VGFLQRAILVYKRTLLLKCVDHSFGLDEDLRFLSPTLWYAKKDTKQTLKQVWFPGLHQSIAGGYLPHAYSDISLIWMISEVATLTHLEFDRDYLAERLQQNHPQNPNWGSVPEPPLSWPDWLVCKVGPKLKRTPGDYRKSQKIPKDCDTCEYLHHSVLERISGTPDGYPPGKAVVGKLPLLDSTGMEFDFGFQADLTTIAHRQAFWMTRD
jgi:hypothetical protein